MIIIVKIVVIISIVIIIIVLFMIIFIVIIIIITITTPIIIIIMQSSCLPSFEKPPAKGSGKFGFSQQYPYPFLIIRGCEMLFDRTPFEHAASLCGAFLNLFIHSWLGSPLRTLWRDCLEWSLLLHNHLWHDMVFFYTLSCCNCIFHLFVFVLTLSFLSVSNLYLHTCFVYFCICIPWIFEFANGRIWN